ncbi:MAG: FHA domain-containing protein [Proteobacteria bacterium]|nr:FHA domain-containing protein [Pseudomonadota bacterium]
MSKPIDVNLWAGQVRGNDGQNRATAMATVPRADFRSYELFCGAYARFADACRAVDEPGVAIVAVDERTRLAAGMAQVRARVGSHGSAILGRHDACDLYLAGHDALALRHLVVIVDPVTDWKPGAACTYRVLDLRTTGGFLDERGRALRGIRCDGPAMIRCGGYAVFVLPLGDPTDWPGSSADAWSYLPERVYFDEVEHLARGSWHPKAPPRSDQRRSQITCVQGVRDPRAGLVDRDLIGTIELVTPEERRTTQVGRAALRDGILLGRYERCDGNVVADNSLSRVHALLIQLDQTLLVIDTASTNGTTTTRGGAPMRIIELQRDADVQLGEATTARWRWLS